MSNFFVLWRAACLERQVERAYRALARRAEHDALRRCAERLAEETATQRASLDRIAPQGSRGRDDPVPVDGLPVREALLAVIAETRAARSFFLDSIDAQSDLEVRGMFRALADQHFRHWMRLAEERDRDGGDRRRYVDLGPSALPDLGG